MAATDAEHELSERIREFAETLREDVADDRDYRGDILAAGRLILQQAEALAKGSANPGLIASVPILRGAIESLEIRADMDGGAA